MRSVWLLESGIDDIPCVSVQVLWIIFMNIATVDSQVLPNLLRFSVVLGALCNRECR